MRVWLILLAAILALSEDYYELLGVSRAATEEEIKKNFKKLSLKYHPDRNQDNLEATQQIFMKIATAYDVLSDPQKRQVYDSRGEKGVSDFEQQQAQDKSYQEMYKGYFQRQKPVFPDLYTDTEVLEMSLSNLDKLYRRKLIWIINFYHPNCGHCVQFKEEFISMSRKLADIMVLAAINCSSNEELCEEYEVTSYPTLVFFPENTAAKPEVYRGERTYQGISDFAVEKMQSFVRLVNSENFQDFYDSNPKSLKVLLFTSRKTTPPLFKVLSKEYKEKISFGEVRNSDIGLVSKFNVTNFPTILALTSLEFPEVYSGEGQKAQIEGWLKSFSGRAVEQPLIRELTKNLQKSTGHCNKSDPTLCVILFADSVFDESVALIKEVAKEFSSDPIAFFWVNKKKYEEFYQGFGETFGVVFKPKKMKFLSFSGVEGLKDVLSNVLSGGGKFERLLMSPELNESKSEL